MRRDARSPSSARWAKSPFGTGRRSRVCSLASVFVGCVLTQHSTTSVAVVVALDATVIATFCSSHPALVSYFLPEIALVCILLVRFVGLKCSCNVG